MAINFPATPTLNQTYTFNGRTWTYNNVGWQATGSTGLTVYTKTNFTATAAQTTFSVTYTVGFVDVYYNGSKLSSSEYTATTGSTVVLGTACALNDIVETIAWTISSSFNPSLGSASATSLAIGGATIGSNALAVTGTTQLNSALNYGGVTLSNAVTGTGNMVLSASPTFTGTALASKLRVAGGVQSNSLVVDKTGSAANRLQIFVGDGTGGTTADENYIANNNTGLHFWGGATGSTEFMTLTNAGLLGIGTTTPTKALDVFNATQRNQIAMSGSNVIAIRWKSTDPNGSERNWEISNNVDQQGALSFRTGATQGSDPTTTRMMIDNTGSLLVGTTTAQVGYFVTISTASFDGLIVTGDSTGTRGVVICRNTNGTVGSITTSGSATAFNTSSDYRLKENVQPMTGGLATVAVLKPVTYDWIADQTAGEGFIAHELQAVIPAAVTGEKDAVDDKGEIKPQGVDFGKIVPHLVAAIQELTTRLAALESK
jgi:hypothetical protein